MIRRPPRSTLFPTRRSSDLIRVRNHQHGCDSLSERERMERGAEDRIWIGAERRSEIRSEEHTSELQSQSNLVCRLLLEKKKKRKKGSIAWEQTDVQSMRVRY